MAQNDEIRSLTGLRGVAATYVVLFHYWSGVGKGNALVTFVGHGYLAVDLFFVLSGFVMAMSYGGMFSKGPALRTYATFLGRRLARIYPLYAVSTLMAALLIRGRMLSFESSIAMSKVKVANLLMIQSWVGWPSLDPPTWSISAEWAAYLLFPLILWSIPRRSGGFYLSSLVWIALTLWLTLPPGKNLPLSPTRCLPEFALGLIAFRTVQKFTFVWIRKRMTLVTLIAAITVIFLFFRNADFLFILTSPVLLCCIYFEGSMPAKLLSHPIPHRLGVLSYSIYLIHQLLSGAVGFIHQFVSAHRIPHGQTFGAIIILPMIYPFAVLTHRFIEVPGRQFLRSIFEPDGLPPAV